MLDVDNMSASLDISAAQPLIVSDAVPENALWNSMNAISGGYLSANFLLALLQVRYLA